MSESKSLCQDLFEQAEALAADFVCAHNYQQGEGWRLGDEIAYLAVVMGKKFTGGLWHVYFWDGEYVIEPSFEGATPEEALQKALAGMPVLIAEQKAALRDYLLSGDCLCDTCKQEVAADHPGAIVLFTPELALLFHDEACAAACPARRHGMG